MAWRTTLRSRSHWRSPRRCGSISDRVCPNAREPGEALT
jgi:hypothetical protein